MKYAWIASNKAHWPISLACDALGVSASGYFEHGRRRCLDKPSKLGGSKRMSDEALLTHIRAIYADGQSGIRLANDVEGVGGTRSPRGQGAGAPPDEESQHPRPMQTQVCGYHRQQAPICRLLLTWCSATSPPLPPIRFGRVTSRISPPTRAGCIWRLLLTCSAARWWAGACRRTCKVAL